MPEMRGPIDPGPDQPNQPPTTDQQPPDAAAQIENRVTGLENLDNKCVLPGTREVGGGGAGGHYALNLEQIEAHAKEVDEIVQEAQQSHRALQEAHNDITPPAPDEHSHGQARQGRESVQKAMAHLKGVIKYGTRFAKDLRASAEKYREAEEHGAGELGKLAE
jgi:hypothetical protein